MLYNKTLSQKAVKKGFACHDIHCTYILTVCKDIKESFRPSGVFYNLVLR